MEANPITYGLNLRYNGRTTTLRPAHWNDERFRNDFVAHVEYQRATVDEADNAAAHFFNFYLSGAGGNNITQVLLRLIYGAEFCDGSSLVPAEVTGDNALPVIPAFVYPDAGGYIAARDIGLDLRRNEDVAAFTEEVRGLNPQQRVLYATFIACTCFRASVKRAADIGAQLTARTRQTFVQITGIHINVNLIPPHQEVLPIMSRTLTRLLPATKELMIIMVSSMTGLLQGSLSSQSEPGGSRSCRLVGKSCCSTEYVIQ